jgi:hypothetical protein
VPWFIHCLVRPATFLFWYRYSEARPSIVLTVHCAYVGTTLSAGAKAGIGIGATVGVLGAGAAAAFVWKRRRAAKAASFGNAV